MRGDQDTTIPDYINTTLAVGQTFVGDAVSLLGIQAGNYTIVTDATAAGSLSFQVTDFDNYEAGPNTLGREATFNNAGYGAVSIPAAYLRTTNLATIQLSSKWGRISYTATAAGKVQVALTLRATSSG
jgi:hypothetical protein